VRRCDLQALSATNEGEAEESLKWVLSEERVKVLGGTTLLGSGLLHSFLGNLLCRLGRSLLDNLRALLGRGLLRRAAEHADGHSVGLRTRDDGRGRRSECRRRGDNQSEEREDELRHAEFYLFGRAKFWRTRCTRLKQSGIHGKTMCND